MKRHVANVAFFLTFAPGHLSGEGAVSHDELGRMLLDTEYDGITLGYTDYYEKGPTGPNTIGGWHPGIDYRAQNPLPTYSPVNGVVHSLDPEGTGLRRLSIKIQGTNNFFIFLHLSSYDVAANGEVHIGDLIGRPRWPAPPPPHLHVEVREGRPLAAFFFGKKDATGVNRDPTAVVTLDQTPVNDPLAPLAVLRTMIREHLDRSFPDWRLAIPSPYDLKTCFDDTSGFLPSVIWGDFDADGGRDYSVQITSGYSVPTASKRQTILLAFLSADRARSPFILDTSIGWTPVLKFAARGTRYFDHEDQIADTYPFDAIVTLYCEKGATAYIYDGTIFRKVIISD